MEQLFKEKNELIASIMWKVQRGPFYFEWWKDSEGKNKIPCFKPLLFHSDANWQMEAIEFLKSKRWHIEIEDNEVTIFDDDVKFFANGTIICCKSNNTKSAIFEALYEFSKIYKKQNENKAKAQSKVGERISTTNKEQTSIS